MRARTKDEDPKKVKADRAKALRKVYQEFDLDGGGDVGEDEMLALGQARRKLGQKSGEWTKEQNKNMMNNMGADKEGNVSVSNFVTYFNGPFFTWTTGTGKQRNISPPHSRKRERRGKKIRVLFAPFGVAARGDHDIPSAFLHHRPWV